MHTEQSSQSAIASVLWKQKVCPICEKKFPPQKHNQKYCSMKCKTLARYIREDRIV